MKTNKNMADVLTKCPYCESEHYEKYKRVPIIKPRRACPKCKVRLRNGGMGDK